MKASRAIMTFGLLFVLIGPSYAAKVGFMLEFDDGPLTGQVAYGSYEVDGTPYAAYRVDSGLLAFNAYVDGVAFSIADEESYPDFPVVWAGPGNVLDKLDYWAELNPDDEQTCHGGCLAIFIDRITGTNYVSFSNQSHLYSYGHVSRFYIVDPDPSGSFKVKSRDDDSQAPSNRELAARAAKYGMTVSELISRGNAVRDGSSSRAVEKK
jgi:hypothetical protein